MRSVRLCLVVATLAVTTCARPGSPTPVCAYTVSPAGHTLDADGGNRSVSVVTSAATCTWSLVPSAGWIAVAGDSARTGSGSFDYTVAPNATPDVRLGTILVGNQVHAVTQQGRSMPPTTCTFAIDPTSATVPGAGGAGAFRVTAPAPCAWTATTAAGWIEIDTGRVGTGDGVVTYRASANPGRDSRDGLIAVAGQTFRLHQDGADVSSCTYAIVPVDFSPCMPSGSATARIETASHCPWTAASREVWLVVDGSSSRMGAGDLRLTFGANYSAPREGVVEVRWPTPTAGQNVRVAQAGCVYATTVPSVTVGVPGGTFSFGVFQQALPNSCGGPLQDACVWSASASAPWVTITTPMPNRGDQNVTFAVAPNPGPQPREATIVVQDRVVTVHQAGP